MVIYATPVEQTVHYLEHLPQLNTKTNLIVTDTGSTKSTIQAFENMLLKHDIHLLMVDTRWLVAISLVYSMLKTSI